MQNGCIKNAAMSRLGGDWRLGGEIERGRFCKLFTSNSFIFSYASRFHSVDNVYVCFCPRLISISFIVSSCSLLLLLWTMCPFHLRLLTRFTSSFVFYRFSFEQRNDILSSYKKKYRRYSRRRDRERDRDLDVALIFNEPFIWCRLLFSFARSASGPVNFNLLPDGRERAGNAYL